MLLQMKVIWNNANIHIVVILNNTQWFSW
jgi:hypothetical protein